MFASKDKTAQRSRAGRFEWERVGDAITNYAPIRFECVVTHPRRNRRLKKAVNHCTPGGRPISMACLFSSLQVERDKRGKRGNSELGTDSTILRRIIDALALSC